jgi:hypothetical protein
VAILVAHNHSSLIKPNEQRPLLRRAIELARTQTIMHANGLFRWKKYISGSLVPYVHERSGASGFK